MHSRLQTQNTSITADHLLRPRMWGSVNALGMNMYGRDQFKSVCLCALSFYERTSWKGHFTFLSLKSGAVCVSLNVAQLTEKEKKKHDPFKGQKKTFFSLMWGVWTIYMTEVVLCVEVVIVSCRERGTGRAGHYGYKNLSGKTHTHTHTHALLFDRWSPQIFCFISAW